LTPFGKAAVNRLGGGEALYPETEALSREVCSLPMNVEITDEEVDCVIAVVRRFYGRGI
jgi:dTDP-4-amino-4,6-dideoxygalactose transaminase